MRFKTAPSLFMLTTLLVLSGCGTRLPKTTPEGSKEATSEIQPPHAKLAMAVLAEPTMTSTANAVGRNVVSPNVGLIPNALFASPGGLVDFSFPLKDIAGREISFADLKLTFVDRGISDLKWCDDSPLDSTERTIYATSNSSGLVKFRIDAGGCIISPQPVARLYMRANGETDWTLVKEFTKILSPDVKKSSGEFGPDGNVSLVDAVFFTQRISNNTYDACADVNNDSSLSLADATLVTRPLAEFHSCLRKPQTCSDIGLDLASSSMVIDAGTRVIPSSPRAHQTLIYAPGTLSSPDTEYVLQNDITAPLTAFTVTTSNITLNLNGHRILYGTQDSSDGASHGVLLSWNVGEVDILNGEVVQGEGLCRGDASGDGCNPIKVLGTGLRELAGIRMVYDTDDTAAVYGPYSSNAIAHHNQIEDYGSVVTNRHQGVDAINFDHATGVAVHHNVILGARHRGIGVGSNSSVFYNEIHINSHATNSYGVFIYQVSDVSVHHNKIFGSGEHPIGIGLLANASQARVFSNYVEVENSRRSVEYGNTGSEGIRTSWGGDKFEIMCNAVSLRAGNYEGQLGTDSWYGTKSWGRAMMLGLPNDWQRADVHHNVVEAVNSDGQSYAAAVATVFPGSSAGLRIRDNTIRSNNSLIVLGDNYGSATQFPLFARNELIRVGAFPTFRTISNKYDAQNATAMLIDNAYSQGAELSEANVSLGFCGAGMSEVREGTFLEDGSIFYTHYLTDSATTIAQGGSSTSFGSCGFSVSP